MPFDLPAGGRLRARDTLCVRGNACVFRPTSWPLGVGEAEGTVGGVGAEQPTSVGRTLDPSGTERGHCESQELTAFRGGDLVTLGAGWTREAASRRDPRELTPPVLEGGTHGDQGPRCSCQVWGRLRGR